MQRGPPPAVGAEALADGQRREARAKLAEHPLGAGREPLEHGARLQPRAPARLDALLKEPPQEGRGAVAARGALAVALGEVRLQAAREEHPLEVAQGGADGLRRAERGRVALAEAQRGEGDLDELKEVGVERGHVLAQLTVDVTRAERVRKPDARHRARVQREAVEPREQRADRERRLARRVVLVLDRVADELAEAARAKLAQPGVGGVGDRRRRRVEHRRRGRAAAAAAAAAPPPPPPPPPRDAPASQWMTCMVRGSKSCRAKASTPLPRRIIAGKRWAYCADQS